MIYLGRAKDLNLCLYRHPDAPLESGLRLYVHLTGIAKGAVGAGDYLVVGESGHHRECWKSDRPTPFFVTHDSGANQAGEPVTFACPLTLG